MDRQPQAQIIELKTKLAERASAPIEVEIAKEKLIDLLMEQIKASTNLEAVKTGERKACWFKLTNVTKDAKNLYTIRAIGNFWKYGASGRDDFKQEINIKLIAY